MKAAVVLLVTLAIAAASGEALRPLRLQGSFRPQWKRLMRFRSQEKHLADGRIIAGTEASRGQFPWQAAVELDGSAFCGGSLISTTVVMTAGHCVSGFSSWEITLGTLLSSGDPNAVTVATTDASLHEDYWSDGSTADNDIAVLHLQQAVTLTDVISPVNLPTRSQVGETFEDEVLTVSGWGLTSDEATTVSPTLQYTTVVAISTSECAETYGDAIDGDIICTVGNPDGATCNAELLRSVGPAKLRPVLPKARSNNDSEKREGRIIGGSDAALGQFPWQASVVLDDSAFCGGSLVRPLCVLTAAHCADGVTTFTITLGTLSSGDDDPNALVITSTTSVVHPDYWSDGSTTDNDVAIVHLPEEVTFTDTISAIRLPTEDQVGETFEGWTATLSGWGKLSDESDTVSPTLQWVNLNVISNTDCEAAFPGRISEDHICTLGATTESPCNGDSGGPLVVLEDDGEYTEVGVVSFGSDFGCSLGVPAAFARVTTYLQWINENLM